ncbi:helix-turn-helix domain-containing protein [Halomonas sp. BN3-1]|uniref:helix-turn-helix domain-containing protein n=1 Tax=Halomonas sp. BN3-1 TaxID=2082393 RepID=UPI000D3B5863|nr:helix-turn-helix domain-containing protein [Halomonas sp. BN3-1]
MDTILVSAKKAAQLLGVSLRTVYRMLDDHELTPVPVRGRKMVRMREIREKFDVKAEPADDQEALGVSSGRRNSCLTKGRGHRTGGSISDRREAVSQLEGLLARRT